MIFRRPKVEAALGPEERASALLDRVRVADEARLGDEVEPLVRALGDESPRVRAAALEALGQLGLRGATVTEAAGVRILDRARDTAPQVRAEAAATLALLPSLACPGRVPALLDLLEDDVASVREEAAAALGDVRHDRPTSPALATEVLDALAERLADPEEGVRFECAYALAIQDDRRGRDVLLDALETPKWRVLAADVLGRLGDPGARPRLSSLAQRPFVHWADRLHVLGALYRLGDESAGSKIVARARAFSRTQREYALWVIGTASVKAGVPLLVELARTRGHKLREAAIRALGALEDPQAAAALLEVARDPRAPEELRLEAARRLSERDDDGRRDALQRLAEESEGELRRAAREGLAEIADREPERRPR